MKEGNANKVYPESQNRRANVLRETSAAPVGERHYLPTDFTQRLTSVFHRAKKRALQARSERSTRSKG